MRRAGCSLVLGDLLSDALRDTDELRPLDEEVAWLQRYAEILESRHLSMLKFEWDVAAEARDVLVPRLLLQPLVENAVKHGRWRDRAGAGSDCACRWKTRRRPAWCVWSKTTAPG